MHAVLRITEKRTESETLLQLEGRLVGPWVEELRKVFSTRYEAQSMSLDLRGVSFADAQGVLLLRKLAETVPLLNCSSFLAQQIQIQLGEESWRR
jgi:anti-anti-sigma regulatory factor